MIVVPIDRAPGKSRDWSAARPNYAGSRQRFMTARDGAMSIMFFKVRSLSRAKGANAVAKAAYISRSKITDHKTGKTHDYRRVGGLAHSEIILPSAVEPTDGSWMKDRTRLWNRAEEAETRRNSRVGREYTVALPHELPDAVRIALARDLARRIADRHGVAVDVAVHRPGKGDVRNHHVHLLATTREIHEHGFTQKASMERSNTRRRSLGLGTTAVEYRELRAIWAARANERMQEAGLAERLEPRSRRTVEFERAAVEARRTEHTAAPSAPEPRPSIAQRAAGNWGVYLKNKSAQRGADASASRGKERNLDHGLGL